MLERVYKADALNVAVQDGVEAGQSVPHVHVHLLPRRSNDEIKGDEIYEKMDSHDGNVGAAWNELLEMQSRRERAEVSETKAIEGGLEAEARRVNRTEDEMRKEAEWLRWEMERQVEIEDRSGTENGVDERRGQFP